LSILCEATPQVKPGTPTRPTSNCPIGHLWTPLIEDEFPERIAFYPVFMRAGTFLSRAVSIACRVSEHSARAGAVLLF